MENKRSDAIKQYSEVILFCRMFDIYYKNLDDEDLGVINNEKHTLSVYCRLLGGDYGKTKKYEFLNNLVMQGALKPIGNTKWGEGELIIYRIDPKRLYYLFLDVPLADKVVDVVQSERLVI